MPDNYPLTYGHPSFTNSPQHAHQLAVKCTQRCLDKPNLPEGIVQELKESLQHSKKKLRQTNAAAISDVIAPWKPSAGGEQGMTRKNFRPRVIKEPRRHDTEAWAEWNEATLLKLEMA